MARAAGAALALAIVVGGAWGYFFPNLHALFGFFIFFPAAGYGWLAAEAVGRAANRRRGTAFQTIAAASCVIAYLLHNLIVPAHTLLPRNDLAGLIFVAVSAIVAIGYLK